MAGGATRAPHIQTYLVADTRERHVRGFIDPLFSAAGLEVTVAQISVGDYMVCQRAPGEEPTVLAIIERKSLKDYAASIRDGRHENRHKMLDYRDRTGCQVYFFVEGPAYPEPTWKVSRMPYSTILASMTSLMVRDGIMVVQTKDEMHTAQRLTDFVAAFSRTESPYRYAAGEPVVGGVRPRHEDAEGPVVPGDVLGVAVKEDALVVSEMWGRLKGITAVTGREISKQVSLREYVEGGGPAPEEFRTAQGRQLNANARRSLAQLRSNSADACRRVLGGVPGISPDTASQIIGTRGLRAVLSSGAGAAAIITVAQKGRTVKLGDVKARRIFHMMGWSGREAPAAASSAERTAPCAAARAADSEVEALLDEVE